ncbi:MAG: hypothetical protein IJO70_02130 [Lachnospiraceae bacterium]|nr:hypothetical protein [Lachnospiraceae bacterium]
MERRVLSVSERNGYIKKLTDMGHSKEVLDLVKDDLEFGLVNDEINLYLDKKWDLRQKKVYSMCLRDELSREVIAVIMREGLDGSQMQVALEFYQKGVPIEMVASVIDKGENAKHMQKAFEAVMSNLESVKTGSAESSVVDREYVQGLVKQIEEAVAKIQFQEQRYDELNKKLKIFENAKQDEAVHNGLVKKLGETEAELSGQQDQLNRANATIARLREQIEEKKKEMEKMQNRIDTLEDKLLERASVATSEKVNVKAEEEKKETASTQTFFDEKPIAEKPYQIPVYYQLPVVDASGRVIQRVQVEKTIRKGNQGAFTGLLGKLGIMKKSRQDIVKLLASGDLVPAQLVQIRCAIEKGLTESQLVELINNNVSAEKMKEIIDIAVLENSMDY